MSAEKRDRSVTVRLNAAEVAQLEAAAAATSDDKSAALRRLLHRAAPIRLDQGWFTCLPRTGTAIVFAVRRGGG